MSYLLEVRATDGRDEPVRTMTRTLAGALASEIRLLRIDPTLARDVATDRVVQRLAADDVLLAVLPGTGPLAGVRWPVLQRARKPVVLVTPRMRRPNQRIRRVLVPLDGTAESAEAVADTMTRLTDAGAELAVLHVFDSSTVPRFWDQAAHAPVVWGDEFLARFCSQEGANLLVRRGVPAEGVLDVARGEDVDMIVLAWSQKLDAGRATTMRRTLDEAQVPVLVVPVLGGQDLVP